MKRVLLPIALFALFAAASVAEAACYADYKAKRDDPLRLHYGVMEVETEDCTRSPAVEEIVSARLKAGGWTLLQVQSVFDETALEAKRADAGEYFLRF